MSGWTQTQPVNPDYYTFTTQSGLNETGLNFGNFLPISVTGNVYNDLNGDGMHDSGEPGLAGWTVDLLDASGNVLASVVTDIQRRLRLRRRRSWHVRDRGGAADELGADPAAVSDRLLLHRQERP